MFRPLRSRSALAVLAAATFMGALGARAGKFEPRPLAERLALADAVVVGKLVALSTRAVSVPYAVEGGKKSDRWFDVGTLRPSAVLKGPKALKKGVKILLDSPGQQDVLWPSHPAAHEVGEEGVWLLIRKEGAGPHSLLGPEQNPLPASSREDAVKALKEKHR